MDSLPSLVFFVLLAAGAIFWLWMLVEVIKAPSDSYFLVGTKLIWVIVIGLVGIIGASIYYFVGRPRHLGGQAAR